MLNVSMQGTQRTITLNGLDVRYYQFGQGEPLLFLHGGRVRAITFKRTLEQLAKHYTVIAPDIPGYGASDTPKTNWSFADYGTFFDEFLGRLELHDVAVVGYSMGGGIALNLAAISKRISRLTLVDSSGLHARNKKRSPHDGQRLLFYLTHPTYYGTLATLLRDYSQFIWKHRGDRERMRHIRHTCATTDYGSALQHVSVPTLILWAKNDRAIPLAAAYEFQKRMPQAELKIVRGNHDWLLYAPLLLRQSML